MFIAPEMASSSSSSSRDPQCTVVFDSAQVRLTFLYADEPILEMIENVPVLHCQEFSVPASEEFVEFLSDGAVAIEVYGHKQANPRRNLALWDLGVIQAKTRSLRERCSDTHKFYD